MASKQMKTLTINGITYEIVDEVARNNSSSSSVTILSSNVDYAVGNNGIIAPTSGWTSDIPATRSGDYLWTRTIITYSDETTTTGYSIGYIGTNGETYYVHIRYAENEPSSDSDILTTPSTWMGVYVGLSTTAPTAYTAYTWNQVRGEAGTPSELVSMTTMYAYNTNGTTQPTTWFTTPELAAADFGDIQGSYLWTQVNMTWSGVSNFDPIYFSSYQGVDGNRIDGLGNIYNAAWTTSSTSAALTNLTEELILPAGTYIIVGYSPTCSNTVLGELKGSVNNQYWQIGTAQSYTWIRTFTEQATLTIATAASTSVTFSSISGKGLQAIRIK